ncbi:MAG TPA: DNA polymerase/3'-5' exonuclease PolX [Pyrinomonadaceae bacterium]|nr:DNA polymerase/3'-5' exonuclease PolX [Pyrinomonadaceae bacterium]
MDKFAIAAALQEIGTFLELKGGDSRFKARAYKRGARAVASVSKDLQDLVAHRSLTSIPGIGNALASQIEQLYLTGTSPVLERLREEFPPGVIELSTVPGLSLSKIEQLHRTLGITSIEELKAAAQEGRLRQLPGFGAKTEEKLLAAIATHETREQLLHIHHAFYVSEQLVDYMRTAPRILDVQSAGALRRAKETVANLQLVASGKQPAGLIKHFLRYPLISEVMDQRQESATVRLADGVTCTLVAVRPENQALSLLLATGSEAHLEKLNKIARKIRLKLKPIARASVSRTTSGIAFRTESDIYRRLEMQYVPPELREDQGEIEAALAGELPEDLVTMADIKGMVHCHTTYSDGRASIADMAHAAEAMSMKYLTITDHSPTASYAGGVTLDRLKRQWDEIAEVQEKVRVKLLKGTESDILADGRLDYPDKILEQLDIVIASIHARYKMDADQMTKRIVTAMRQPVFKIWGHGLGRLIQRRPPFECHIDEILDAISESRAAVEINGDPYRLDLEPRLVREARKRNIPFVISVDAHSTEAMKNLKFGVGIARRGWVRRGEVLNALSAKAFAQAVHP